MSRLRPLTCGPATCGPATNLGILSRLVAGRRTEWNRAMQSQSSNVLDLHTFSVSAIRALNMAVAIMRRFGHRALNTEHTLLALLNQGDGNANKILQHFGVDLFALRGALEQYLVEATTVP